MKKTGYQPATKGIIIARVSTEDQAKEDRFSLPTQLNRIRDYAKKNDIKVVREYEFSESAYKGKRRKFQAAIDEAFKLSSRETIALMMFEEDRLTRKAVSDAMLALQKAIEAGQIELHFALDGKAINRNSSPSDILMFRIKCDMAEHESAGKARKVKETIKLKLLQGIFPGGRLPIGYLPSTTEITPGLAKKIIIIDQERAPFVQECFKLYSTGKHSVASLTKSMRAAGFTKNHQRVRVNDELMERAPKLVDEGSIRRILRDIFYTGQFLYMNPDSGERELYPTEGLAKNFEALISKELFKKVQKILDNNNTHLRGFKKNTFLFRGLVTCGFCGCTLTPEEMSRNYKNKTSPQASEVYYHCTGGKAFADPDFYKREFKIRHSGIYISKKGKRKGETIYGCPSKWLRESDIETTMLCEFRNINYGEEIYDFLKKVIEENYEDEAATTKIQLKASRAEFTKNEAYISALVRSISTENDADLKNEMRRMYKAVKSRQNELSEEIRFDEQSLETSTDEVILKLSYCSNLSEQYTALDLEGKQKLLSECFSKIISWHGDSNVLTTQDGDLAHEGLEFDYNEPFKTLFDLNIEDLGKYSNEMVGSWWGPTKKRGVEPFLIP